MTQNKNNVFKPLAGLALAVAVGAQIISTGQLVAQSSVTPAVPATSETESTNTLETMIVTGSAIPSAEEVGANPVQVIGRAEIEKSSYSTAAEIIKSLPSANSGGVPISNNATGFTPGASAVSLRGLGPDATLVLINGKRVAPYPTGQGGNVSFVDLNTIPAAAVESVEVLADGASTLYGADAVAGVVNIKLRKDYEGAELHTRIGNTTDKDSTEFSTSLLFGTTTENTRITGVVDYYHRNSIFQKDRGYSKTPPFQSSNSVPGNYRITSAAAEAVLGFNPYTNGGTSGYATPVTSPKLGLNPYGAANVYYGPTNTVANGLLFNNSEVNPLSQSSRPSAFNFNSTAGSFPEYEKYGSTVNFEHDVVKDTVTLYATGSYNYSFSRNELAPPATGNFANPLQTDLIIPANAPGAVYQEGDVAGTPTGTRALSDGSYNPFNPFQQEISGGSRYRLLDAGNRVYRDETDAVLFQGGVKGRNLPGNWGYDVSGNYSRIKTLSRAQTVSISKFNTILDASSSIFDPTSDTYIGTSTPYNPFAPAGTTTQNNMDTIKYAQVTTKDRAESELTTFDANINNPELFTLPGGPVGLALGGQFRKEQINQNPDQLSLDGDIVGNSAGSATNAGRKTAGFYGELNIPIFGGEFTAPGIYALSVDGSFRFEEIEHSGDNVLVPKVTLRWQPFQDLTIRGTYGKGFREPSLYELFGPANAGLNAITNSATGSTNFETDVVTVGNQNLEPEDSEAFTGGFVYSPKFVKGLTLSAGYWQVERSGVVTASNQDTFNRYLAGNLLPGESVTFQPGGDPAEPFDIALITTPYNNTTRDIAKGFDFGIAYNLPTKFGTLDFVANATYLDSFKSTTRDGLDPLIEVAGQDDSGLTGGSASDAYLQWKGVFATTYTIEAFQAVATVNYLDRFEDLDNNSNPYSVNSQTTLDLYASYTFGKDAKSETASETSAGYTKDGKSMPATVATVVKSKPWYSDVTVGVGVRNVTDEKPPTAYGNGGNSSGYPDFIYTSEGRFVFLELTKKF